MATHHEDHNLTPEEKRYRECMTTGDDFTKIEIFRSAASWYKKALEIKPGDEEATRKLDEVREKIKKENRAIYAILATGVVVVLVLILLT